MKKHQDSLALRASVLAVRGALIALAMVPAAYAAEEADLTKPTNKFELGLTNTDKGSFKFGEYNGLQKKGVTLDAGFELRGGNAYDGSGTARFGITGTNLGTDNRSMSAEFGEQGKFQFNFGYDQLRKNRSDTYQSPYMGLGTNNLTLPRTWVTPMQLNYPTGAQTAYSTSTNLRTLDPSFVANDVIFNGAAGGLPVSQAATAAQQAQMNAIAATDKALYNNFDVFTTRKKYEVGFGFNFNTQWDIKATARHELRDGTQLRNTVSRNTNLDAGMTMPIVINQSTDQYDLSLNFKDEQKFLSLAYYGSLFKNANDSMTWEGWQTALNFGLMPAGSVSAYPTGIGAFQNNLISTGAPNNQFHQFSMTGGYDFSKTTKLTAYASYARNTQNQAFESEELKWASNGTNSLNGLVVTKTLNLKLTTKPVKDLGLTAAYKYNDRDNKTAVNTYAYDDVGESNSGTKSVWAGVGGMPATLLGSAININANRPYSKRTQDINLDANYKLANSHNVTAGYDWQKIERYCDGTWIACSEAPKSTENRLRLEWRAAVTEDLNAKVGYAYSQRKTDYNEMAWLSLVPMANFINTAAATAGVTQSAYQAMLANGFNGWGPLAGFPMTGAGVAMTAAQQIAAFGVNRAYYWANNNVLPAQIGYGNVNVIYDPYGFRRYFDANRNQDKLRARMDWQANEKVGLEVGVDYTNDKYQDMSYGMNNEKIATVNLGASFKANDDLTANVFYTYEDRKQSNKSNARGANSSAVNVSGATAITPDGGCLTSAGVVASTIALRNVDQKLNSCGDWSSDRTDKTNTWGLAFKQKNLAGGKLDVMGDLMWARSKSDNTVSGGTWANNPYAVTGAPAGTVAAFFIPATPLPTYTADTYTLKLTGNYRFDKTSSVRVAYSYNRMKIVDWQMDDLSIGGGLTGVLPTNEKAPDFTVQTISAAYIFSFK